VLPLRGEVQNARETHQKGERKKEVSREPTIVINGSTISDGAAMTIRCALTNFAYDLRRNGLGEDDHGKFMAAAYLTHIRQIQDLIDKTPQLRGIDPCSLSDT
jgi:hypothetical protein